MKVPPPNRILAAASTSLLALAVGACETTGMADPGESGEARLAEMIRGKTAGEPQACIPAMLGNRLTVIDRTAVVYDAGGTVYVARPRDPRSLDDRDVLVIERSGGQLCASDIVRTVDRFQGYTTGVVFLEDFVPYR